MAGDSGYPTVLIVYQDRKFREVLTSKLQSKGYLVLAAEDAVEAFEIVTHHSRRIHLLLTDDSHDGRSMAATLKPYRPDMTVIHISPNQELSLILTEVAKGLGPPD
jgi:CheY-like chemotaxis protein